MKNRRYKTKINRDLHANFHHYLSPNVGMEVIMECREQCGACCITPSISSAIPGMPKGKPAGVRCIQLTDQNKCKLFGKADRPKVCVSLNPSVEICGVSQNDAINYWDMLDKQTK